MIRRTALALVSVFVLTTMLYADTFEFLTFTPPAGWTKLTTTDGVVYRRANGVGLISFYTSRPTAGTPADEFAKMWREKIEAPLSIKPVQPRIETDGAYKVALGAQNVDAQGTITAITLVTIVGNGRTIGLSTVAAGNDVLGEVNSFLDTISLEKAPVAASPGGIEVDFDIPPGYVPQRDGNAIVLKPTTLDRNTPCVYGFSPARPSSGSLETDARAAVLEPLPGWQLKSDHHNALRGVSGAGWQYYWLRTDVQQMSGGSMQYLTVMSMAFPAGAGRTNIFWGFGATGPCTLDDATFLRLFFSLRPRGVTSDGGKALAKELNGLWRDTQRSGMAQYKFAPNGSYAYEMGTSTTFGNLETTTGSTGDGRWSLKGSELTLTGRRAGKYHVRVYDEYLGGVWRRGMSVFSPSSKLEVHYMKVQ